MDIPRDPRWDRWPAPPFRASRGWIEKVTAWICRHRVTCRVLVNVYWYAASFAVGRELGPVLPWWVFFLVWLPVYAITSFVLESILTHWVMRLDRYQDFWG